MADQFIAPLPPLPKNKSIIDTVGDMAAAVVASNPVTRGAASLYNAVTEDPTAPPQHNVATLPDLHAIAALPPEQRQQAYANALTGRPVEGVPNAAPPPVIKDTSAPVRLTPAQIAENAAAPPSPSGGGGFRDPYAEPLAALQEESDRLASGANTERLMTSNEQKQAALSAGDEAYHMDEGFKREVDTLKRDVQSNLDRKNQLVNDYLNGKVDQTRLIRNKSTAQKLLGFASAVTSGILLGMGRTQTNQALERMDKEIEQDNLEQQRELVAKLQSAKEFGATAEDIQKAISQAQILAAGKREAFWKRYAHELDTIALTHKGAIDKAQFDFAQNEIKRLAMQAERDALRKALSAAAGQRQKLREKIAEGVATTSDKVRTTAGAEPLNEALLVEQRLAAATGQPARFRNPQTGKAEFLPPAVASSPSGEGSMKETAIHEHEKEAKVEDMALRFNKLDRLYEGDTLSFGQTTGLGDTGNSIEQNESAIVKDMMRVGLTSDKDAARILRQIARGRTQSRDNWKENVADTLLSEYNSIANPADRAKAAQYISTVFNQLQIKSK